MAASQEKLHPLYAIVGKDSFLRQEALEGVLRRCAEVGATGPIRLSGAQASPAGVLDDVRSPSLWGERRIVILEDADPFITAHRTALEKYSGEPNPSSTLILLCETLPRNTRLYKAISAQGEVIAFEPPKGRALAAWLEARARSEFGKRLDGETAARMIELLGDSPGLLSAELAKLCSYVGERAEIGSSDVDALTGHLRVDIIFAVTDCILDGLAAEALGRWRQIQATDRSASGRALGGLAWSVRRFREARGAWERGASLMELGRRLFTEAAVLKRRFESFPPARLIEQQRDLLAADLASKTGASTFEVGIEKFIVKHASRARGAT